MSIIRALRTTAVVGIGLALTACSGASTAADSPSASASEVTISTNLGEVTVPVNPERVAVLDSTAFETIHDMGITPVALPKQLLPTSLQDWADNPDIIDIGTHREPDLEALASSEPDLILGGKRFSEIQDTLESLAPTIDIAASTDSDDYIAELKKETETLGEIFDQEEKADELIAELDKAVEKAADLTDGQTVFLANHNGGKIDNGAGRLAPLIQPLDMTDVFAETDGDATSDSVHQDSGLAPETIAQANPDWMIVLDRDASTSNRKQLSQDEYPAKATIEATEALKDTTAVKEGQIFYLDVDFYVTEGIEAYTKFYNDFAEVLEAHA